MVNAWWKMSISSIESMVLQHTSYTSLNGSIQNAALVEIKLAHDASEYIGTLACISIDINEALEVVHQQNPNNVTLQQRLPIILPISHIGIGESSKLETNAYA